MQHAPQRGTIYLEDLKPGMSRSLTKRIDGADIDAFAEVSSDRNPVHLDEDYAASTLFGGRIAHGMHTAALVSAVIGEQLPGHGTIYMSQNLTFLAPVRPGDTVTATVEVTEINREKRRVTLMADCKVDGKTVLRGEACVLAPTRPV